MQKLPPLLPKGEYLRTRLLEEETELVEQIEEEYEKPKEEFNKTLQTPHLFTYEAYLEMSDEEFDDARSGSLKKKRNLFLKNMFLLEKYYEFLSKLEAKISSWADELETARRKLVRDVVSKGDIQNLNEEDLYYDLDSDIYGEIRDQHLECTGFLRAANTIFSNKKSTLNLLNSECRNFLNDDCKLHISEPKEYVQKTRLRPAVGNVNVH